MRNIRGKKRGVFNSVATRAMAYGLAVTLALGGALYSCGDGGNGNPYAGEWYINNVSIKCDGGGCINVYLTVSVDKNGEFTITSCDAIIIGKFSKEGEISGDVHIPEKDKEGTIYGSCYNLDACVMEFNMPGCSGYDELNDAEWIWER